MATTGTGKGGARRPKWPIIYVRGYAMTKGEQDDTAADPFCGFNLGSTVYRATPHKDRPPRKFVFESPVVRLGLEHGYRSVYDNGFDIVDADWKTGRPDEERCIPAQSIIVYRYYDEASRLLGRGETPPITKFAEGLGQLILTVRDRVCADPKAGISKKAFRCYLVAHSMGGLVCRTFLQNGKHGDAEARACVDKFFTYATPHNGIDLLGINVPAWLTKNDIANFNRETMAEYLALGKLFAASKRVDWLPESALPSRRVFCMIGTNRADYEAGIGLSRAFAGHGSDGLVRVENASVWGVGADGKLSEPCATAYAYRAHSGHFGIVNSEEAYQNLVRFLFGDVRIDVWAEVDSVSVPENVRKWAGKRKLEALYQIELQATPRGKRWFLTRRVAEEDSVACRTLAQLQSAKPADRTAYLSSAFLEETARVDPQRDSLGYVVTFGVRVPEYEAEGIFFGKDHMEGGSLFRDTLLLEVTKPKRAGGKWKVRAKWTLDGDPLESSFQGAELAGKGRDVEVPFANETPLGGMKGRLRFRVSPWG